MPIANKFNDYARWERLKTPFATGLSLRFPEATVLEVIKKLEDLQIPLPENNRQYLSATDGALMFSNSHGVVIRIEQSNGKGYNSASRSDDSAWMLQPLGSLEAGNAVIEICPGVEFEERDVESRKLYWKMWGDGFQYWDDRIDNAGRLPFKSPEFPEGVPVVIDRLAVNRLTDSIAPVKRALKVMLGPMSDNFRSPLRDPKVKLRDVLSEFRQMAREITAKIVRHGMSSGMAMGADNPQEILYGDLRRSFTQAFPEGRNAPPDAKKMTAFWQAVLLAKEAGKLVTGWKDTADKHAAKSRRARDMAEGYDAHPHRIGEIGEDVALKNKVLQQLQDFRAGNGQRGGETQDSRGTWRRFREITTTPQDGGETLTMKMPDPDFRQPPVELESVCGITGISGGYTYPYGLKPAEIESYADVLQHSFLRGDIDAGERGNMVQEVFALLEKKNPALSAIDFDRQDADRMQAVLKGIARGWNARDIGFSLSAEGQGVMQSPGYQELARKTMLPGEEGTWRPAPETMTLIARKMQDKAEASVAITAKAGAAPA
ncbi:MAG: hypothetical protein GC185_00355 [Alphaproteobacteria bacterium]|nr:hypothetical protein [Alphaproteobacteria bacterium]